MYLKYTPLRFSKITVFASPKTESPRTLDHPHVTAAVADLKERGIPTFSLLSDFAQGVRESYIGANNLKVGRTAGWLTASIARTPGKIGVFIGGHRFHGHELRETGFRSYLREYAPEFELLNPQANLETRQLTYEATCDLLEKHQDLVALYVAGGGMEGAIAAMREMRTPGEVVLGRRLVQVGFMRRYDAGYVALKKVVDSEIGAPLMVHAAHRNPAVPEQYVTPMAIHDTLIHEIDVLRWLLNDDYVSAQVVFPRVSSHSHSQLRDPQIILLETKKGVRIDVEVFVNCRYGYDIQCQVVGEEGLANLPEPMSIVMRKDARQQNALLTDWKDRFIASYDVELQDFLNAAAKGTASGPSSWDGYVAAISSDACVKAQETGEIVPISLPERPALYN